MSFKSPHKDWKLAALAVPDAKAVGVDELLTQLWLRVAYDNRPTSLSGDLYKKVAELAAKIESSRAPKFNGFEKSPGVAEAWLRADLLRVLKRPPDLTLFSVARPLHLPATRLRNVGKSGDSGASGIVYTWLSEEDPKLLEDLKEWISYRASDDSIEDLPSYALALLADDDAAEKTKSTPVPMPQVLCRMQGRLYVEDLRAILAYRGKLPRAAIIEHVGRLTAMHLGLYLLRTYAAVVDIERTGEARCQDCAAEVSATGDARRCPYHPQLVFDCGEDSRAISARLAEASWLEQEDLLARYVRAHLTLRKLFEFAKDLEREPLPADTLEEVAAVRSKARRGRLDDKARDRISSLIDSAAAAEKWELSEAREQYRNLGLSDFDAYMALLFQESEASWFKYLRFLLDSLFLKNERDGLMRQPIGGRRVRRFVLTPGVLETLALVALIRNTDRGPETRPIRLDELVDRLEFRYGFLVGRPVDGQRSDPVAVAGMLDNLKMLRQRLRESGLFVDLSDAYLAQKLKPRVEVRQ